MTLPRWFDARGLAVHDLLGVHARVDLASIAQDRAGETFQILERVKSCLPRKPKRWTAVPETEGNPIDQLCIVDSSTVSGLELAFELLALGVAAKEQEPSTRWNSQSIVFLDAIVSMR